MLNHIELKNFRQHTHLKLTFVAGINVIRGANESGKSTLMEAIAYAFFGSKAARNNDLTQHGTRANSHSVTLNFTIQGNTYTLTRSARGAELIAAGVRVTGQIDTARYCEQLLQLKPNSSHKLMFVSQNQMKGILQEGNSKITALIEQLADLGQINELIDILQTHYHTGKTDLIEHSLEQFVQQEQDWAEQIRQTPNPQAVRDEELKQTQQILEQTQARIQTLKTQQTQQNQHFEQIQAQEAQRALLMTQYQAAQMQLAQAKETLNATLLSFDPLQLNQAKQDLAKQEALYHQWQDYISMQNWQVKQRYHGNQQDLEQHIAHLAQTLQQQQQQRAHIYAHIQQNQAKITDDYVCPTCQREWENSEQKRLHNAQIQIELNRLQQQIHKLDQTIQTTQTQLEQHQFIRNQALPDLVSSSQWCITLPESYPPHYIWKGVIPIYDPSTHAQIQHTVQQLSQQAYAFEQQECLRQTAQKQQQQAQMQLCQIQEQLSKLPHHDETSQDLRQALDRIQTQLNQEQQQQYQAQRHLTSIEQQYQTNTRHLTQLHQRQQAAQAQVQHYQQALNQAKQARTLLKILRQAHPQMTEQIWQNLCHSISHYFSQMRGTESLVNHSQEGFSVDGQDIGSLSGSTQDILGLAVRIALIKTFSPNSSLLLLDEPFAAADHARTIQSLGFLTTLGFEQIIIVTHEDITEAIAEQVIQL